MDKSEETSKPSLDWHLARIIKGDKDPRLELTFSPVCNVVQYTFNPCHATAGIFRSQSPRAQELRPEYSGQMNTQLYATFHTSSVAYNQEDS